jgi:hypothetical protein
MPIADERAPLNPIKTTTAIVVKQMMSLMRSVVPCLCMTLYAIGSSGFKQGRTEIVRIKIF